MNIAFFLGFYRTDLALAARIQTLDRTRAPSAPMRSPPSAKLSKPYVVAIMCLPTRSLPAYRR